ncbi:MAG TPA: hypothetical protein VFS22_05030 [Flavisolibacter sp.]|nr:hypothetical protein [Flavisolibacter sp.]
MLREVIIGYLMLLSCTTTSSTSKEVKKDTKDKRDLPVLIYARAADPSKNYFINLRANNFFDYHDKDTDAKDQLYAGTYSIKGKTLVLAFQNNYHPDGLTDMATIDTAKKEIVLIATDPLQSRIMIIITPSR